MEGNKELIKLAIWTVVIGGLLRLHGGEVGSREFQPTLRETREELRKCTWPSKNELKGSTVVIIIASLVLGFMIVAADFFDYAGSYQVYDDTLRLKGRL